MATGRDTQLTRQVGEYLAAAELGRRGWIATTFTGSVPGFDLLAINEAGRIIEIQVKAIRSASWQLNASQFIEIELRDGVQYIVGTGTPRPSRFCVFVVLGSGTGTDQFFVFKWADLQEHLRHHYAAGRRPRNPETTHHALYPKDIAGYRDNWDILAAE